ncbi:MAG: response regulator [candidate division Zixibacteria bacterium]|nr:response regulator [Gammaproteobacteria bacterium]NIX57509.1 response regulator [candidate division Zixibacteria bacterium]
MDALLFCEYDDEASILKNLLQYAGLETRLIKHLSRAIESWPEKPADLIFISLTDKKYLETISQIRNHTVVPIIILAELLSEDTQVMFYEKGVDLIIIKPYSVRLLLAKIRSLLRRSAGMPYFSLPTLSTGKLNLDPGTRTVQVLDGEPRKLTQLEFRLLYSLMTNTGHIIPTENIVEQVWGYQGEGNKDLVRGLVQRLRSKVEPDPANPKFILTEQGIGYFFNREA